MDIKIDTDYDEQLAATIYENNNDSRVLLIAPAVGVPQSYYKYIATYFSEHHYSVLTFDYSGIGASKPVNHPELCSMQNWGFRDLNAVIDFCVQRFNQKPIYLIGHSIGGQIFPLAKSKIHIKRAYFVASQNVANRHWSGIYRFQANVLWYVLLPVFNTLCNGLPGVVYGGKEKLPKRAASEWALGGRSQGGMPEYVVDGYQKYEETKTPVKFVSFSDDHLLSPKRATAALCESYGSGEKEHQHIDPSEFDLAEIGHFGFFRKSMEMLWDDIEKWFNRD